MTVWRYTAVDRARHLRRTGELAASTAVEARVSLRRIGLQVIELRPLRQPGAAARSRLGRLEVVQSILAAANRHRRTRRRSLRAELHDSLATLLESGVPLAEAVQTLIDSSGPRGRARRMLVPLREAIRDGATLDAAMRAHLGWFDDIEIALVEAGRHGGQLPAALRSLADEHERADELGQKLLASLAYPAIVASAGVLVVGFLSLRTLPQLVAILDGASVEPPALTIAVMTSGQSVAAHWLPLVSGAAALAIAGTVLPDVLRRMGFKLPAQLRRFAPRTLRRLAASEVTIRLAALVRAGVPVVDALRVVAPGARGQGLSAHLLDAASRVERGEDLAAALGCDLWFDASFRRLLLVEQHTGELATLLERLGERERRRARRLIDRAAALLEPIVILVLAGLVGIVVMATVLPLLRLQEVI